MPLQKHKPKKQVINNSMLCPPLEGRRELKHKDGNMMEEYYRGTEFDGATAYKELQSS